MSSALTRKARRTVSISLLLIILILRLCHTMLESKLRPAHACRWRMILMSRNKKWQHSKYWFRDKLLKTDVFGEIISRDRYLILLKMLHSIDNNQKSSDCLQKISSILSRLEKSFRNSFYSFQNLCQDQNLLLFKHRLSFKQYIRTKEADLALKRTY